MLCNFRVFCPPCPHTHPTLFLAHKSTYYSFREGTRSHSGTKLSLTHNHNGGGFRSLPNLLQLGDLRQIAGSLHASVSSFVTQADQHLPQGCRKD